MLKHNDFIVGKFHDQLVIRKTKAGTRSYTILPNVLFLSFSSGYPIFLLLISHNNPFHFPFLH